MPVFVLTHFVAGSTVRTLLVLSLELVALYLKVLTHLLRLQFHFS